MVLSLFYQRLYRAVSGGVRVKQWMVGPRGAFWSARPGN
jgi:hypothetical protein